MSNSSTHRTASDQLTDDPEAAMARATTFARRILSIPKSAVVSPAKPKPRTVKGKRKPDA